MSRVASRFLDAPAFKADRAAGLKTVLGEQAFAIGEAHHTSENSASLPHVHPDTLQIILAVSGDCLVTVDEEVKSVSGPCLVTVPGGGVHNFEIQSEATGWAATIANHRALDLVVSRGLDLGFLLRRPHLIDFVDSDADLDDLAASMRMLVREFQSRQEGHQAGIEALHQLILIQTTRLIRQGTIGSDRQEDRKRELFLAFRALVEQRFLSERGLSGYLKELGCSAVTLNRVCRRFAGLSAKGVILDRLADEARRRLVFTSASATQIGYALGFLEPSYFVRFFRKSSGMTPGQFRRAKGYSTPDTAATVLIRGDAAQP